MSNTFTIEPWGGDRPFLLESTLEVLRETYPPFRQVGRIEQRERAEALIARYEESPGGCLVAQCDGQAVGIIWWVTEWHPITEERAGLILLVRVVESYRRRGIGRALLQEAKKAAERLRLFVNPENQAAYALYRSLGFTPQIVELAWQ